MGVRDTAGIIRVCAFCKTEYTPKRIDFQVKYCSPKCQQADRPRRKPSICLHCKQFFIATTHQLFCGHACAASHNQLGKKRKPIVFCTSCGKDTKGSHYKFCSQKCHLDFKSKKTGEEIEAGKVSNRPTLR